MNKERNVGIDLLRIVSMCMIIMIHMNGYGKASENIDAFSFKYLISQLLAFLTSCAVDSYALISGYVNLNKSEERNSLSSLLKLWLQVFFYSVLFMSIFKVSYEQEIGRRQMIEAVFPAMSMQYWYFTCYIPVLILLPYLNAFLKNMDIHSMRRLILTIISVFSIVPWIFQTDWFGLNGGFSAFWLIILYLVGAWIKRESDEEKSIFNKCKKRYLLIMLFGIVIVQIFVRLGLDKVGEMLGKEEQLMHSFSNSTSPLILMEAILLLTVFVKIKISNERLRNIITKVGAASFGVYLIHDNQYVRRFVLRDRLQWIGQMNVISYIFTMVCVAAAIYICCAIIDIMRKILFEVVVKMCKKSIK